MHVCVDMFGGMLPAVFPVIRKEFDLSITHGVWLLALFGLLCNGVQIISGHLRPHNSKPLLIPLGLLAASSLCWVAFLLRTDYPVVWLWAFVLFCGLGIGVLHPEGLRGIYSLDRIPPTLATAVFINGGLFAVGMWAWLGTLAVDKWELDGLLLFLPGPILCVLLVYVLRIRLTVDKKPTEEPDSAHDHLNAFFPILLMSMPYAASATIMLCLLPSALEELNFSLTFGGLSVMLMVAGGALGSLFWAAWARTRGELWCCTLALWVGLPVLLAYLMLIEHQWAVCLLAVAASCSLSVFPLMVSLARHARGANLGGRMGIMIGGSFGVGSVALLALGPIAERYGVRSVVNFGWIGIVVAGVYGLLLLRRRRATA